MTNHHGIHGDALPYGPGYQSFLEASSEHQNCHLEHEFLATAIVKPRDNEELLNEPENEMKNYYFNFSKSKLDKDM